MTWDPEDHPTDGVTVSLVLCTGPSSNCVPADTAIASGIPAAQKSYDWKVPCDLAPGQQNTATGYGMLIIVDGTGEFQCKNRTLTGPYSRQTLTDHRLDPVLLPREQELRQFLIVLIPPRRERDHHHPPWRFRPDRSSCPANRFLHLDIHRGRQWHHGDLHRHCDQHWRQGKLGRRDNHHSCVPRDLVQW